MKSIGIRKGFATFAGLGILAGLMTLSQPAQARDGGVVWRGSVDDVARVVIRGNSVRTYAVSGRSPYSVSSRTMGGQPDFGDRVNLDSTQGRGTIRIAQYPDRGNNFTTIVEIRDPQGGSAPYEFRLNWSDNGGPGRGNGRPGDGRPGWGNGRPGDGRPGRDDDRWDAAEREAFRHGFEQGRRDFQDRRRPDYARYRNQYNNRTEAEFRRGYQDGFANRNRPW